MMVLSPVSLVYHCYRVAGLRLSTLTLTDNRLLHYHDSVNPLLYYIHVMYLTVMSSSQLLSARPHLLLYS